MIGFIHIPKNGGSSIKHWLRSNGIEIAGIQHQTFSQVDVDRAPWWFAVTRNPFERIVSYYEFTRIKSARMLKKNIDDIARQAHTTALDLYYTGFKNWLFNYGTVNTQFNITQTQFITRDDQKINIVLRLESIELDWKIIQERTGIYKPLQISNTTKKLSNNYFDSESIEFVINHWREDFINFDYPYTTDL